MLDKCFNLFILTPRKRPPDVQFDIGRKGYPFPLRALRRAVSRPGGAPVLDCRCGRRVPQPTPRRGLQRQVVFSGQDAADVLDRRGFGRLLPGIMLPDQRLHLRVIQRLKLPADLGKRQMLFLQQLDELQPVRMPLVVSCARPLRTGRRKQPPLYIKVHRSRGNPGFPAKLFDVVYVVWHEGLI